MEENVLGLLSLFTLDFLLPITLPCWVVTNTMYQSQLYKRMSMFDSVPDSLLYNRNEIILS